MQVFNLPKHTVVNKVIPKNAFDSYTNTKQKKLFVEVIERIRWMNKLSPETTNLAGKDVQEIQVFEIELRKKDKIETLLDIIDKAIPYHIIFVLRFENERLISLSQKHPHPTNDNQAVIDWSFRGNWFDIENVPFAMNLKVSLDEVFSDLCFQISGKVKTSISELIQQEEEIKRLNDEAAKLQSAIKKSKQFNEKVELNLKLQSVNEKLVKIQCKG
jgi:uncharacterized protein (UPF0248 family)